LAAFNSEVLLADSDAKKRNTLSRLDSREKMLGSRFKSSRSAML